MDEDVEERYGSVGGRVFLGKFEVFGEGVEEGEERFCVLSVSEGSEAVVNGTNWWVAKEKLCISGLESFKMR